MARWPHDDPASLAAFYGDPAKDEPGRQLVPVVPPFTMYYAGKPIPHIMFHKKAAGALSAALAEIWESCQRSQAKIDRLGISTFSGSYNPRRISGSTRWSNHAYGAAIDFDAAHNGFNTGHGTMPQLVVDAFTRQGALWGGDYKGRTDPMHFEFCSRDAAPVALVGDVQADGDTDQDAPPPQPAPAPTATGFFSRARNWIVSAGSGVGLTGLGALTDWQIVALLLAFVLLCGLGGFMIALWLWGKRDVAGWIARHIA